MRFAVAALVVLSGMAATTWTVQRRDVPYDDDARVIEHIRHPPKTLAVPDDVQLPHFESGSKPADPRSLVITVSPRAIRFPISDVELDPDADLRRLRIALDWARRRFPDDELLVVADANTAFGTLAGVLTALDKTGWRWRFVARALDGNVAVPLPKYAPRQHHGLRPTTPNLDLHASIRDGNVPVTANGIALASCGPIARCAAYVKGTSPDFADEREASIAADPSTPLQTVLDVAAQLFDVFPVVSLRLD